MLLLGLVAENCFSGFFRVDLIAASFIWSCGRLCFLINNLRKRFSLQLEIALSTAEPRWGELMPEHNTAMLEMAKRKKRSSRSATSCWIREKFSRISTRLIVSLSFKNFAKI